MSQPHLGECEDEIHTPEMGTWESFRTPQISECNCRGQNTSHLNDLYIIGKLLKCRCRKWPRMRHLDICSTSYGKKKGQESNCQFDSRPLKNRESTQLQCVQVKCNTPLESSWGKLQVCFRPHPNRRSEEIVMIAQSLESPNRDNFGIPSWESRDKKPFGCGCRVERYKVHYMGEGDGFPRVWAVVNQVSPELPVACPNTKGAAECELTNLLIGLM